MSVKYNKIKGAAFEIDVMKWFRSKGFKAERLRLAGVEDEGDVVVIVADRTYLFELKNTARLDLEEFWRQATIEAKNYAKKRDVEQPLHYVLYKRKRKGIHKTWVIQELEQWLEEKQ